MKALPLRFAIACFALIGCVSAVRAEDLGKSAEKLVEQLHSDDFDARQHAARALEQQGESARAALERASADDDADVRSAVAKLIAKLSRATLRLHVIDIEGKALANTEGLLQLYTHDTDPNTPANESVLKLDASGNADIKLATLGSARFQIKLPGVMDDADSYWVAFNAHAGINPVNVTVKRGGSLAGSVLDAAGHPIKDATVTLFSGINFEADLLEMQVLYYAQLAAGGQFNAYAATGHGRVATMGADGKWELTGVPEGVYACVAQAPGHLPALGATVRVREGASTLVPGITMKPRNAGKIEIKFKKPDGSPLAKTSVSIYITQIYPEALRQRIPLTLQNTPVHSDEKETDESGTVLIEDISPGNYNLIASMVIERSKDGQLLQSDIDVKAGETLRLEQRDAASKVLSDKKGSIKGRIMNANGKGAKGIIVHLYKEREIQTLLTNPNVFNRNDANGEKEARTDSKGIYRFDNVTPGKYALMFGARESVESDPDGYIFGVAVENDKQFPAPEAVLNNAAQKAGAVTFKGRILLPNGSPAGNAEVLCFANRQSQTATTQPDGTFSAIIPGLNLTRGQHSKDFVVVRYSDCKPFLAEGPFPAAGRDFKLEPQAYGSLRVTVTDRAGKPLAGVRVTAASQVLYALNPAEAQQGAVTNSKGVARLNGLAVGARELSASHPGYFVPPHSADAIVVANEEKEFKMTLDAGTTLRGHVTFPPGYTTENGLVMLNGNDYQNVDAAGTFTFSGVTPGRRFLTAEAPGLVARKGVIIPVPQHFEKQPPIPDTILELVRPGGIAIDCGKEFSGCSAKLEAVEALDSIASELFSFSSASGTVDAGGRVEFSNVAPGQYCVRLTENDALSQTDDASTIRIHSTAGPFEVKPVASLAAVAKMEAIKISPKRGTASASGHLQLMTSPHRFEDESAASISIRVQGALGVTAGTINDPIVSFLHPAEPLVVIGTPPEGVKLRVPGTFEIEALTAGQYKIFAMLNSSEGNEDDDALLNTENALKLIATFTIKDGEKLNLGEVKFEPVDDAGKRNPNDFLKSFLRPQDKPQEFEP